MTTQLSCQTNRDCVWNKTNNSICKNKINCVDYTSQKECINEDSKSCRWVQNDGQQCSIKPDACQLTKDKKACNYGSSNCDFTQSKQATCIAKGPFNCGKNGDEESCGNQDNCLWNKQICLSKNTCINELTKAACLNNITKSFQFCDFVVNSCILNKNAATTCSQKKGKKDECLAIGCVWDIAYPEQCVAPDASNCFLINDEVPYCSISNDSVCKGLGMCQDKKDVCTNTPIDQCGQMDAGHFCSVGQCEDNQDYCKVDNCKDQPTCDYTPPIQASCVNDDKNNNCNFQTSKKDCLKLKYCNYNNQHDLCLNQQNCSVFNKSLCSGHPSCSWESVYECQQIQTLRTNQQSN